jgi:hypothetical protein
MWSGKPISSTVYCAVSSFAAHHQVGVSLLV